MCYIYKWLDVSVSTMEGKPWALTICTDISVKNFRQMVLVFFFGTENGNGIDLYHLQNTDMKPDTSNPNKWYKKFRSFR